MGPMSGGISASSDPRAEHRSRHRFSLACLAGVVFAHNTLQLGKFIDHLSDEVKLANFGRSVDIAANLLVQG